MTGTGVTLHDRPCRDLDKPRISSLCTLGTGRAMYRTIMTKRDFDRETKAVHRYMASDERCSYRETRCLPHRGSGSHYPTETRDRVAERAARMRQLRGWRYSWEGEIAALGRGSPYRAPAVYRARAGKSLLE